MKLNKLFAAFMLITAVAFAACEPVNPPGTGGPGNGQGGNEDTTVVTPGAPDTIGWNIPAECLTVAEANAICAQLESGATTGTKYYVKGWVKKLANGHADGISKFNNALFYMIDTKENATEDFYAYQVYGLDGAKITNPDAVAVGDYVVIYGELTNYNGTYETVGKGAAHIWKSTNPALSGGSNPGNNNPTEVVGDGSMENPYTANDVLLLNNSNAGKYWVKAYIVGQINGKSISGAEFNAPFSGSSNDDGSVNNYNTNILIADNADEANSGNCVPVQLPNGALRTGLNLVQNPDLDGVEVLIYGSLEAYFGAAGVKSPEYAKVGDKEFGVNPNVEQKEPTAKVVTIKEFIDAPESPEVYYELTGVITSVSNTTYGNFYLKDETGEVLIYGLCSPTGAQKYWAASGAKVGDTITVQTVRTSYNGAPQGKNALFVELTPFVAEKSEWGVVGDLTSWGNNDIAMYTTWHTKNLFVAYNVEITSGAFKIRANNAWNDAKNYGLKVAGNIYANSYYTLLNGSGSQNITPMAYGTYDVYFSLAAEKVWLMTPGQRPADPSVNPGTGGGSAPAESPFEVAMRRAGASAAFFLTVPGPKMIWQFGEIGYDISIEENGRTGEKPVKTDEYMAVPARKALYDTYAALLKFRRENPRFFDSDASFTWTPTGNLKKITCTADGKTFHVVGNFGKGQTSYTVPSGSWTDQINGGTVSGTITLKEGEFRLLMK